MKLTTEQRIERAHVQLMRDPDFCLFSGVFMIGDVKVSDVVPTAYTNGRDVTYGRAFVDNLNDGELAFVVLHEAMHKAYRHLFVWKKLAQENMRLANVAMDYVINLQLMDYNKPNVVQFPKDSDGNFIGLLDERFRGMDTKQVYDILKEEEKCKPRRGNDGDGDGNGGDGQNDEESKCLDDHGWNEAKELGEKEVEKLNREIDQALREGSILAGRMNGNISREIKDLLTPKVDWKQVLREFVKSTMMGRNKSTWRRPNRRFIAQGIVMPTSYSDKIGGIAIDIDTSGSILGEILGQFLGEVKCICDEVLPDTIDLIYWDHHVAKHEKYESNEVASLIESTKPKGGGGTDPSCIPIFMRENNIKPQCSIILTDGYFHGCGDWTDTGGPILWCVVGNKSFVPSVGKVVHIS